MNRYDLAWRSNNLSAASMRTCGLPFDFLNILVCMFFGHGGIARRPIPPPPPRAYPPVDTPDNVMLNCRSNFVIIIVTQRCAAPVSCKVLANGLLSSAANVGIKFPSRTAYFLQKWMGKELSAMDLTGETGGGGRNGERLGKVKPTFVTDATNGSSSFQGI